MTTNTSYGSWANRGDRYNVSIEATVADAVNGGDNDWRERLQSSGAFDRIVSDYRAAIDAALPGDVALCGDEFIGPAYPKDTEFDGYPVDEFGALSIAAIVEDIDLMAIVERHDPDNN